MRVQTTRFASTFYTRKGLSTECRGSVVYCSRYFCDGMRYEGDTISASVHAWTDVSPDIVLFVPRGALRNAQKPPR